MDTSALLAKVHLAQSVAQRLSLGDAATIKVPGLSSDVPAKVALISPAFDPGSTTVEVWLRIDNKKGELKFGTPVHATVTGRSIANALKVPAAAVLTAQDGSKSVMVIGTDGTSHRKPVDLASGCRDRAGSQRSIASGHRYNWWAYRLEDGTKVKIRHSRRRRQNRCRQKWRREIDVLHKHPSGQCT